LTLASGSESGDSAEEVAGTKRSAQSSLTGPCTKRAAASSLASPVPTGCPGDDVVPMKPSPSLYLSPKSMLEFAMDLDLSPLLPPRLPPAAAECPPILSLEEDVGGGKSSSRDSGRVTVCEAEATSRCWREWQCALSTSLIGASAFSRAALMPAAKAADMPTTMKILARLSPRQIEALHPPSQLLVTELQQRMVERLLGPCKARLARADQ